MVMINGLVGKKYRIPYEIRGMANEYGFFGNTNLYIKIKEGKGWREKLLQL